MKGVRGPCPRWRSARGGLAGADEICLGRAISGCVRLGFGSRLDRAMICWRSSASWGHAPTGHHVRPRPQIEMEIAWLAVRELERGAGEPTTDTLPFLRDRALRNDEHWDVRRAAVGSCRGAGEPTPTPSQSSRTAPQRQALGRSPGGGAGAGAGLANRRRHPPLPSRTASATTSMGTFARRRCGSCAGVAWNRPRRHTLPSLKDRTPATTSTGTFAGRRWQGRIGGGAARTDADTLPLLKDRAPATTSTGAFAGRRWRRRRAGDGAGRSRDPRLPRGKRVSTRKKSFRTIMAERSIMTQIQPYSSGSAMQERHAIMSGSPMRASRPWLTWPRRRSVTSRPGSCSISGFP